MGIWAGRLLFFFGKHYHDSAYYSALRLTATGMTVILRNSAFVGESNLTLRICMKSVEMKDSSWFPTGMASRLG